METIKGKTESGFEFEIDKNLGDDWDVLEILSTIEDGNEANAVLATVKLAKLILGKEQTNKLKEHCKNESGRPSTMLMTKEIMEIFKGAGSSSKNS